MPSKTFLRTTLEDLKAGARFAASVKALAQVTTPQGSNLDLGQVLSVDFPHEMKAGAGHRAAGANHPR